MGLSSLKNETLADKRTNTCRCMTRQRSNNDHNQTYACVPEMILKLDVGDVLYHYCTLSY
jgi:hypothetical protein